MKKILLALIILITSVTAFSQSGNDTTKYVYYRYMYGNRLARYWADTVLMVPRDTTYSKYGLAIKGSTIYVGNGIKWTSAGSGGGGVNDTIHIVDYGVGLVLVHPSASGDSLKFSTISGINGLIFSKLSDSTIQGQVDSSLYSTKYYASHAYGANNGLSLNGTNFQLGSSALSANMRIYGSNRSWIVDSLSSFNMASVNTANGDRGYVSNSSTTSRIGVNAGASAMSAIVNLAQTGSTSTASIELGTSGVAYQFLQLRATDTSAIMRTPRFRWDGIDTTLANSGIYLNQIQYHDSSGLKGLGWLPATGKLYWTTLGTGSGGGGSFFPLAGGSITGTAGAGFVGLIPQSSPPGTPASGVRLYARSTGGLSWVGTNGFTRTFLGTNLTADHVWNFQNKDYTLADSADVAALSGRTVGTDSVQAYSSGTTLTQTAGYNIIQINPSTTQASLTITTATTFHTNNTLMIVAGGTITAGTVITSFSIVGGAGLTVIQSITPTTINAGEVITYKKVGSFLYRIM